MASGDSLTLWMLGEQQRAAAQQKDQQECRRAGRASGIFASV
jgi:hypothetical protein